MNRVEFSAISSYEEPVIRTTKCLEHKKEKIKEFDSEVCHLLRCSSDENTSSNYRPVETFFLNSFHGRMDHPNSLFH